MAPSEHFCLSVVFGFLWRYPDVFGVNLSHDLVLTTKGRKASAKVSWTSWIVDNEDKFRTQTQVRQCDHTVRMVDSRHCFCNLLILCRQSLGRPFDVIELDDHSQVEEVEDDDGMANMVSRARHLHSLGEPGARCEGRLWN